MDKDSMIRSATLKQVRALPETACVNCPNAVWHLTQKDRKEELRIFCLLMHALIDMPMAACDGTLIFPKM